MGAIVEVKFFNNFVLKKTINQSQPVWMGSFGIPADKSGYPSITGLTTQEENWAIEESRIRGGYNNTSTAYGAKAYLVEEDPNGYIRFNSLIYSGIYNSRTGVNDTNVFSTGQDITKSTDPANGSIQKLYAEDTNLIIFQENKISRALIDKDAIYSAEGGGAITNSNLVIGTIQPFPGKYGISKNPESFAVYGYNKYFSDKNNNVILKLSGGNIAEISGVGMRDYFRDELNTLDLAGTPGFIIGGWDLYNSQYVISTQQDSSKSSKPRFNTLSWDEQVGGWTSFYDYRPDQAFSVRNNFYTTNEDNLYKHYSTTSPRAQFYGVTNPASVTFIFNPEPTRSKYFKTLNYEGSNGWQASSVVSDPTGQDQSVSSTSVYINNNDTGQTILSQLGGEYAYDSNGNVITRANYNLNPPNGFGTNNPAVPRYYAGFNRKENNYAANLVNDSSAMRSEVIFGNQISGLKGYYLTVQMSTDAVTNVGAEKQLFSVATNYSNNNGY
jgi:hypothetical protein|tara:strand:- start:13389 stop:14879 length:1491 start_codon:yes stop_codon:yes gene_type:complete